MASPMEILIERPTISCNAWTPLETTKIGRRTRDTYLRVGGSDGSNREIVTVARLRFNVMCITVCICISIIMASALFP